MIFLSLLAGVELWRDAAHLGPNILTSRAMHQLPCLLGLMCYFEGKQTWDELSLICPNLCLVQPGCGKGPCRRVREGWHIY